MRRRGRDRRGGAGDLLDGRGGSAGGDRGRATSSYFFSRILGQALGAAAFGGVLNSGLRGSHAADLAEALIDPARRLALDAATLARDSGLLEGAIHGVFRTAWILALVVLLLTLTLPARARLQERGGG